MQQEWGKSLRKFRNLAGYSQVEFTAALLELESELSKEKLDVLVREGILPLIIDNSELSRYENGKRLPRNRSRFISLIYALVRFGGLQNSEEANKWLGQADQAPLNENECSLVFDSIPAQNLVDRSISDPIPEKEKTNEEAPISFSRQGFAMWSSLLAVIFLLLSVIYILLPTDEVGFGRLNVLRNLLINSDSPTAGIVSGGQTDPSGISDSITHLGDFSEGYDGWDTAEIIDGMQTVSLKGGALCGDIANAGSHPWAIRWWKDGIVLGANNRYQLSFDVISNVDRSIDLFISDRDKLKIYYYGAHTITSGSQRLTVEFNQYLSDPVAAISFLMGGHFPGEVCFDNFELVHIETLNRTQSAAPAETVENSVDGKTFRNGWLETWEVNHGTNTAFDMMVESEEICFHIKENGSEIGSVNIRNHAIDIKGGQAYFMSFDVTSSNDKAIASAWVKHGVNESWKLKAGSQTVEHRFVGQQSEDDIYFLFNLSGPDGSRICIEDIIFRRED